MLPITHKPAAELDTRRSRPTGATAPGFTLMEVLVAVTILGVGFVALFGVLSGSLGTVSRIEDRETLVRTAQMKLNEICLALRQGREPDARSGEFGGKYRWQAEIEDAGGDEEREVPAGPTGWPVSGSRSPGRAARPRTAIKLETMTLGPRPTRPMTRRVTKGEKRYPRRLTKNHEGPRSDTDLLQRHAKPASGSLTSKSTKATIWFFVPFVAIPGKHPAAELCKRLHWSIRANSCPFVVRPYFSPLLSTFSRFK